MRRASAVSVSGALLLALLCIAFVSLLANPVRAQQVDDPNDPLDGEEVTLSDTDGDQIANRVLIGGNTNCTIGANATVTVQGTDGQPATLTNQAPVQITQAATEIVIDRTDQGNLDNLGSGNGEVTESSGITCDVTTPATQQYGDGDVDDPDDVVLGTEDKGPLPNTGGAPLIFGAAALALSAALLARRLLAP
jgi:hypothetical protein